MALETNHEPSERESITSAPSTAAALRSIVAEWGLSPDAAVRRICESENVTFLAAAPDGERIVFRIHRQGYNDVDQIRSEHAWIEALREARTVTTPAVCRRRDGGTVGRVSINGVDRYVVAFEFMGGQEPSVDHDLPAWFVRLGELTARLHRHSRDWDRPSAFRRKVWNLRTTLGDRPHWGDWRNALGLDSEGRRLLLRTVEEIAARLALYGSASQRFGLIHGDLRLANLLVNDDRLGVIDFDDCGFGWFMYDFAASVSFIEHDPIVDELRRAWIEGYRAVAPLAVEDEAILDVMVMLRRVLLTAWIASHPASETAKALGVSFTTGTVDLAERFLSRSAPPYR